MLVRGRHGSKHSSFSHMTKLLTFLLHHPALPEDLESLHHIVFIRIYIRIFVYNNALTITTQLPLGYSILPLPHTSQHWSSVLRVSFCVHTSGVKIENSAGLNPRQNMWTLVFTHQCLDEILI